MTRTGYNSEARPRELRASSAGQTMMMRCGYILLRIMMVNKAVYGTLPAKPPAPLEQVIDGSVKTGVDLSPVVDWTYENSAEILADGKPIPAVLHGRLSRSQDSPFPRASHDHWLDRTLT